MSSSNHKKNTLTNKIVIDAIKSTKKTFQSRQNEFNNKNIERTVPKEIEDNLEHTYEEFTFFRDIELFDDDPILLKDNNSDSMYSIVFIDCIIPGIKIENSNINTVYNELLNLYFIRTTCSELEVNKSSIGNIKYYDHSKNDEFIIDKNSTIKESITINHSKINNLFVNDSNIESFFFRCSIIGVMDFMIKNSYVNYLNAFSSLFNFYINNSNITVTNISEKCRVPLFRISGKVKSEIYVRNISINQLDLSRISLTSDTTLSLSSIDIFTCIIEETTISGRIFFRNIRPLKKDFPLPVEFFDSPLRQYYSKFKKSVFRIAYSSMGQTEFIDSDLKNFDLFEFSNSRITDMFVSGIKAPSSNLYIYEEREGSISWHEQFVSFYNQFSKIFEAQEHIYNSVRYRSKSALHQQKVLGMKVLGMKVFHPFIKCSQLLLIKVFKLYKSRYKSLRRRIRNKFKHLQFVIDETKNHTQKPPILDYLVYLFNYFSNKHGESWLRALIFILLSSCLLFHLYLQSAGYEINLRIEELNWTVFSYYFEFVNPVRPFNFMKDLGISMNGWIRFIDLISRIVISLGLFQFLTAFRKYRKR